MRLLKGLEIIILICCLTGCGPILRRWQDSNNFMVSAENININETKNHQAVFCKDNTKKCVGQVVNDSLEKCNKFLNGLVLAENSVNSGLDMSTTVLSALGTAVTPISTVHALTAGATITSGWKGVINSDIYAKASIANYAEAIQATYYKDLAQYIDTLSNMPDNKVVFWLELAKIQTIHRECSLASAQSSISATLQSTTTTSPTKSRQNATTSTSETLTVTGTVTTGDKITLKATSSAIPGSPVSVIYTVAPGDDLTKVATGLLNAVRNNKTLADAKIEAIQASTKPNNSIVLRSPVSTGVKWSSQPATGQTEVINLTAGGTVTTGSTPSPITDTKAAVPGSRIQ